MVQNEMSENETTVTLEETLWKGKPLQRETADGDDSIMTVGEGLGGG